MSKTIDPIVPFNEYFMNGWNDAKEGRVFSPDRSIRTSRADYYDGYIGYKEAKNTDNPYRTTWVWYRGKRVSSKGLEL